MFAHGCVRVSPQPSTFISRLKLALKSTRSTETIYVSDNALVIWEATEEGCDFHWAAGLVAKD